MPAAALSMILAPGRGSINATNVFVIALVLGAVGLVMWASRPSVIARYSADRRETDDDDGTDTRA